MKYTYLKYWSKITWNEHIHCLRKYSLNLIYNSHINLCSLPPRNSVRRVCSLYVCSLQSRNVEPERKWTTTYYCEPYQWNTNRQIWSSALLPTGLAILTHKIMQITHSVLLHLLSCCWQSHTFDSLQLMTFDLLGSEEDLLFNKWLTTSLYLMADAWKACRSILWSMVEPYHYYSLTILK